MAIKSGEEQAERHVCKYLKERCKEDRARLLGDAQLKTTRKWTQTEFQGIPPKHQKPLCCDEVDHAVDQAAQ